MLYHKNVYIQIYFKRHGRQRKRSNLGCIIFCVQLLWFNYSLTCIYAFSCQQKTYNKIIKWIELTLNKSWVKINDWNKTKVAVATVSQHCIELLYNAWFFSLKTESSVHNWSMSRWMWNWSELVFFFACRGGLHGIWRGPGGNKVGGEYMSTCSVQWNLKISLGHFALLRHSLTFQLTQFSVYCQVISVRL